MDITITRERNYSRSYAYGRAWVWSYRYTLSEDHGRFKAGVPVGYGRGLASLRDMLRRSFPGAAVTEAWKGNAR